MIFGNLNSKHLVLNPFLIILLSFLIFSIILLSFLFIVQLNSSKRRFVQSIHLQLFEISMTLFISNYHWWLKRSDHVAVSWDITAFSAGYCNCAHLLFIDYLRPRTCFIAYFIWSHVCNSEYIKYAKIRVPSVLEACDEM